MYRGFSIYDFCAFMIIICLILSIFLRKLWRYKTSRVFLVALCTCAVAIIENSVYLKITSNPLTPKLMTVAYIAKYLYFVSLIVLIVFSYVYLISTMGLFRLINKKNSYYRINIVFLTAIPIIFLVLSFPFKWIFEISVDNAYIIHFGHYIYYALLNLIFLFGVHTAIKNKKYLTHLKKIDCIILYPLNIVNIAHQMLHSDYSFIMFVIAMTFYVISTTTQRPEDLINPTLQAKASSSFYRDTDSILLTGQEIYHIYVKILNHSQIKKYVGERSYIEFLSSVSNRIHAIINDTKSFADLYYLEDSEFCISIDGSKHRYVKKISNEVCELFYNEYDFSSFKVYPDVRSCIVRIPYDIEKSTYLYYFAKAFHHIVPSEKTPILFENIAQSNEFRIKNEIESIIKKAIKTDRFDVFFQPILNIRDGKIDSAEALLRLTDEKYGNISPNIFIPFAEINGVILQIGEIVFRKVLTFVKSNEFTKSGLKYIQVNLTLAQCMESNFAEKVIALLDEYNIEPSKIQFEITQSMEGYNIEVIESNISKLHEKGIVFALDDYGVGYSNIKQVITLPIDIVKLHKSFVQEIENEQMKIIINGTITMLKNLGKKVLIEGVESQEGFDYFNSLECKIENEEQPVKVCDFVQGYYISKPVSINGLLKLLK